MAAGTTVKARKSLIYREKRLHQNKQRLLAYKQTGAIDYLSGPAAKGYLQAEPFEPQAVGLHWFEYSGYPGYPQLWGPFEHRVSIVDLLFNCGTESANYMKHVAL